MCASFLMIQAAIKIGSAVAKSPTVRRYSRQAIEAVAKKTYSLGRHLVMGEGKDWRLIPIRKGRKSA